MSASLLPRNVDRDRVYVVSAVIVFEFAAVGWLLSCCWRRPLPEAFLWTASLVQVVVHVAQRTPTAAVRCPLNPV